MDSQNKSPSAASSVWPSDFSTVHSHGGYSESSMATGSVLLLRKLRPLSGVPAGTELWTRAGALEALVLLGGCAVEVDVAGALGEADRAASVVGASADAARVVVKARTEEEEAALGAERRPREPARRRQRGQIIVFAGWRGGKGGVVGKCSNLQASMRELRRTDPPAGDACRAVVVPAQPGRL